MADPYHGEGQHAAHLVRQAYDDAAGLRAEVDRLQVEVERRQE